MQNSVQSVNQGAQENQTLSQNALFDNLKMHDFDQYLQKTILFQNRVLSSPGERVKSRLKQLGSAKA